MWERVLTARSWVRCLDNAAGLAYLSPSTLELVSWFAASSHAGCARSSMSAPPPNTSLADAPALGTLSSLLGPPRRFPRRSCARCASGTVGALLPRWNTRHRLLSRVLRPRARNAQSHPLRVVSFACKARAISRPVGLLPPPRSHPTEASGARARVARWYVLAEARCCHGGLGLIQQAIFSCSKNNMAQHFDPLLARL